MRFSLFNGSFISHTIVRIALMQEAEAGTSADLHPELISVLNIADLAASDSVGVIFFLWN